MRRPLRHTGSVRSRKLLGLGSASALLLVLAGCAEPLSVAWNDTQSVIEPVPLEPQVSPPQGALTVYSERSIVYNGDIQRFIRRPVEVYTVDGQLAASERYPFGEGPIRFALSPGYYIAVSRSRGQWRQVQVDVREGRETVVAESQLDQAPSLASTPLKPTPQRLAHRSRPSQDSPTENGGVLK
jgi:hypothetical protein